MRRYVRAKIHGLRVTNSALRYHGSVGIDDELLKAAGIDQFEAVDVVNLNTGSRWQTYALSAGKAVDLVRLHNTLRKAKEAIG